MRYLIPILLLIASPAWAETFHDHILNSCVGGVQSDTPTERSKTAPVQDMMHMICECMAATADKELTEQQKASVLNLKPGDTIDPAIQKSINASAMPCGDQVRAQGKARQ